MRPAWMVLALCLVAGCADGDGPTAPKDDHMLPISPYATWTHGPSTDPSYFPIAVWLQSPSNAAAYQEIGVNLYVGLWQGPTETQLADLAAAGMQVICAQNAVGLAHADESTIVAWMHGDEPDNAQPTADGGYGPAIRPATLQADRERLMAADPTRPVWLNLGQGVANEDWVGRGGPREDYPGYVAATDIVSFDVYPVAGLRLDDGERLLWYPAKGVDSLRAWGGDIVWNVIGTTRISADRGPTPAQVRSEVWQSIVHGSRGIVYFCHEWNPVFREARLLEDEAMRLGVSRVNAQIHRLAPVLNDVTVEGRVEVTVDGDVPVDVLVKAHDGDLYLFACAMRQGTAAPRFAVAEAGDGPIEVVDEDRSLSLVDGAFQDTFAADYEVHIYRIAGGEP